jgi:apolipoprotein N-acyltransferase
MTLFTGAFSRNALQTGMPLWVALVVATVGGLLVRTSFPAPAIWPFAFAGLALILLALRGRSFWTGMLVGLFAGGALWGSLIFWLTLYLGPIPWLALCALMTLWVGVSGGLIALVYKWTAKSASPWIEFAAAPVVVGAIWAARETLAASWPYGGFSWARLAYSQAESPFNDVVSWIGVAGLSFAVAVVSSLAVAILVNPRRRPMYVWGALTLVLVLVPVFPSSVSGTTRVLVAQGNSKAGLFDAQNPGQVLSDHVSATLAAADDPKATSIDMIVWPENGSDIDPLRSENAARAIDAVATKFAAPVVAGTITNPMGETYFNSSIVWTPGEGVTAQYDKKRPVPFAEYMPNRAFFRALVPDLVDLVTRDYSIGSRRNVVDVNGVEAGISICFDITDNALTREMVAGGAQIILAQTNNADFGTTDENLQQLAIARLAAIESARTVVNDSTVGTTAIIRADGSTQAQLDPYTPGYLIADVDLRETVTPAMVAGSFVEVGVVGLSLAGLIGLGVNSRIGRGGARKLRSR